MWVLAGWGLGAEVIISRCWKSQKWDDSGSDNADIKQLEVSLSALFTMLGATGLQMLADCRLLIGESLDLGN